MFRIVTVILVIIDVTCVIVDLATPEEQPGLETVSLIIVSYFMLEIGARLFVYGYVLTVNICIIGQLRLM